MVVPDSVGVDEVEREGEGDTDKLKDGVAELEALDEG
jgi:hypothetical protein